jgi:hypothetical protein
LIHAFKQLIVARKNDQAENLIWRTYSKGAQQILPKFENCKFSYDDLKEITNNFKNNIGTGGYGSVYLGHLENGLQVAVKMLSQSSTQGVREFLAEVITTHAIITFYL